MMKIMMVLMTERLWLKIRNNCKEMELEKQFDGIFHKHKLLFVNNKAMHFDMRENLVCLLVCLLAHYLTDKFVVL